MSSNMWCFENCAVTCIGVFTQPILSSNAVNSQFRNLLVALYASCPNTRKSNVVLLTLALRFWYWYFRWRWLHALRLLAGF